MRTAFVLGLSSTYGEDPDLYGVTVSWTRVPDGDACARAGNRTVQLQSTIQIPKQGAATLHGDAGLIVEIRRR